MNWEAIGAVGEIVGAIAVIGTVGYLVSQIKQSRKATLAEIYQNPNEICDGIALLMLERERLNDGTLRSPCFC